MAADRAQYSKTNAGQVRKAELPEPLDIGSGSWSVQRGNTALVTALETYLCQAQTSGKLAALYEDDFEVPESDFAKMVDGVEDFQPPRVNPRGGLCFDI